MEFGRFLVFMCRYFCVCVLGVRGGYGAFIVGMGVFSALLW